MARQSYESAASTKVRMAINTIEPQHFLNLNFPNHLNLDICLMFVKIRIVSQIGTTGNLNCSEIFNKDFKIKLLNQTREDEKRNLLLTDSGM